MKQLYYTLNLSSCVIAIGDCGFSPSCFKGHATSFIKSFIKERSSSNFTTMEINETRTRKTCSWCLEEVEALKVWCQEKKGRYQQSTATVTRRRRRGSNQQQSKEQRCVCMAALQPLNAPAQLSLQSCLLPTGGGRWKVTSMHDSVVREGKVLILILVILSVHY